MKTMTCDQLGGPCDLAHSGASADEVIKAQDRHLKEAWKNPFAGMGWYRQVKRDFAALPEG